MKILIIIPILNPDEKFFKTTIPLLQKQSVEHELLLINSGEDIAAGNYKTVKIKKEEFNHANTRNIALQYDADFYLFMTQDSLAFDEYLIEELIKPFNDDEVAISYARQIPYENAHITEKFARNANYPTNSFVKSKEDIVKLGIKTYFTSNSCAMYRGDYFRQQNGFKKNLNCSEDMEFTFRAIWDNKKVFYTAKAKVYHSHVYTCKALYERYKNIGKFFLDNSEIDESIKSGKSTERTGFNQAIKEFQYVLRYQPNAIFKLLLFTTVKYLAYKLGRYT